MKTKTIEKILRRKITDWTDTIADKALVKLIHLDTIVSGGCIASMLRDEPVSDFDIYFATHETTLRVAEYYVTAWNLTNPADESVEVLNLPDRVKILIPSLGIVDEQDQDQEVVEAESELGIRSPEPVAQLSLPQYRPIFFSSNAITLSQKIQIVARFYGTPDEIHRNFDFIHCQNYWESGTGRLVLKAEALSSLLTKELVYRGSLYPVCSMIRTRKFVRRGWTINAGQFLKMALQISELNLQNPEVLEDQLVGVDSAYFRHVINFMRAYPEKTTTTYLTEVIDRIFG